MTMRRLVLAFAAFAVSACASAAAPAPEPPAAAASDSITLERSLCYGFCPAYTVTIERDGDVLFVGRQYVEHPGEHRAQADPTAAAQLFAMAHAAHFYDLKAAYRAEITDIPSFTVTLREGGREKSVVDYGGHLVGMPQSVSALQDEIDRVAGTARWIGDNRR